MSVWFLRKNNKVGFLEQILNAGTLSMTVEDMWYGNINDVVIDESDAYFDIERIFQNGKRKVSGLCW